MTKNITVTAEIEVDGEQPTKCADICDYFDEDLAFCSLFQTRLVVQVSDNAAMIGTRCAECVLAPEV
jgi:hypothetical protein